MKIGQWIKSTEWLFEYINKGNKPCVKPNKKRECCKLQYQTWKKIIVTNGLNIKRIIKEAMDDSILLINLNKMEPFPKRCKGPKYTQGKINWIVLCLFREIELIIITVQKQKLQD